MKLLAVSVLVLCGSVLGALAEPGQIKVTGQGSVSAVPDMATISLGVTTEDRDAAKALAANSAAVSVVLDRVSAAGIASRDIQTNGLSLSPLWSKSGSTGDGRRKISGYSASNQVTIRVRVLDELGGIVTAAVRGGANQFNGLEFGVQNPAPLLEDARRAAVADGVARASLYADAANVTLGAILEISEQDAYRGPQPMRAADMSVAVPVAGGEISIGASVTIVFAIDQ